MQILSGEESFHNPCCEAYAESDFRNQYLFGLKINNHLEGRIVKNGPFVNALSGVEFVIGRERCSQRQHLEIVN